MTRDRGVYLAREAIAHSGSADPEQAADAGMRALAIAQETGSGRITNELAQLNTDLDRWPNMPLLSCAMSVDGYLDDTSGERLMLSNEADLDRVDQVRAESDAILIGATTLRRDNPRLLVKSAERRAAREARGLPAYPLKVTVTMSGDLDPELKFWHYGGDKLVCCPDSAVAKVRERLGELAELVGLGETLDFGAMLDDLGERGIGRLMVEGGGTIHTQFLTEERE